MISLVVCIKRRADFTAEQFARYWRDVHAPLLLSCADFTRHVISYVQHHPLDGGSPVAAMFGTANGYDGVAVLTFADEDAIARAFSEPRYLEDVRPDEFRFIDMEGGLSFITRPATIKGG